MALGLFNKPGESDKTPDNAHYNNGLLTDQISSHPNAVADEENAGLAPTRSTGTTRLGRPRQKSLAATESDDNSDMTPEFALQKQKDAESGNSIQYRTCSWKKVGPVHTIKQ